MDFDILKIVSVFKETTNFCVFHHNFAITINLLDCRPRISEITIPAISGLIAAVQCVIPYNKKTTQVCCFSFFLGWETHETDAIWI
jgi:hypothetical protein